MKSALKLWLATFLSFLLVACGGGGSITDTGGGDGGTAPTDTITVTASIDRQEIDAENPATITANVKGSISGAKSGKLVTFKLNDESMGTFTPATGTALTDSNGNASIQLSTADKAGAGTVTASVDSGEESEPVGFVMKGDGGTSTGGAQVSVTMVDSDGNAIDSIKSTSPGFLVATVSGISKATIVTFTSTLGEIPVATAVTENGKASVQILAGSQPGAGVATATLLSGEKGDFIFKVGATNVLMGSGDPFQSGVASVSPAQVSAGGTASIGIMLKDDSGNLFTEPVEVKFSSVCGSQGTAELSSPVVTVNGAATTTYLAKGCVGDDTVNVSANVGGKSLSAKATLNVLPASIGSIFFLDATPENIRLKGTGGTESSTVRFKVLDKNGNPVSNQMVSFQLNTESGGIELDPVSATTNSEGITQTVVNAGTVSTPVRVTASVTGSSPLISSQSNQLVISTGLPDQDSISLSADILNPEAWDHDGVVVQVTARLADAFNNPVPDGTAVRFTTEGGVIEPSCLTEDGSCTVKWTSQSPRPTGDALGIDPPELSNNLGQPYAGRVTVLATAIGEESFPDANGNGRFDFAEWENFKTKNDIQGYPYDLKEAFVDYNEDGFFNPGEKDANGDPVVGENGGDLEVFVDFNNDKSFTTNDGLYNGSLCARDESNAVHEGCSETVQSVNVRDSLVLVMSGSEAYSTTPVIVDSCTDDLTKVDVCDGLNSNDTLDIIGKSAGGISIIISDLHNQPLPAGTVVKFSPSVGSLASKGEFIVESSSYNGATGYSVIFKGADQADSGTIVIETTTPLGKTTLVATIPMVIH
ncbi:hypothetical protein MJ923_05435 [Shewanella sp. 3B26]|uniref:Big-1 domain-containing protein n=1 Tax=Shewanella zhuhaiensis TaxID=2919576 RepID=A0AAJ1BH85_9GAMM|nr:invasin domain 3-containing protein [Shewanella zhuhaiensis]MCH4293744.1 hypothetical protein [Shewanella zhuhaiensis]